MGKIAFVTDSNSGFLQAEANEAGITVIPMPFLIGEETYYENVTLTYDEFYQKLESNIDISTSQPSPDVVIATWNRLLAEYDEIVHIPMSSGLSGTTQTALMVAQDFENRVFVVDNKRISVTQKQSVYDAIELAKQGLTAKQIRDRLEEVRLESSIYIMLDTLKYLRKGGRLTPAVAALGTALRLKPVLQIQGDKLDAFAIAKTKKKGIEKMLSAMEQDINERFGGIDQVHIEVAHTNNQEAAEEFVEMIKERFGVEKVVVDPLSLSVACHIGAGSLAIACSKKIDCC